MTAIQYRHAFQPTPFSIGDCCVAMVMRDGNGDQCGLPRGHGVHFQPCGCFPHGPDEPCTCDGCWACAGRVKGCTCDIAWDCTHEGGRRPATTTIEVWKTAAIQRQLLDYIRMKTNIAPEVHCDEMGRIQRVTLTFTELIVIAGTPVFGVDKPNA